MPNPSLFQLAEKYLVDDLPGATIVGARLHEIICRIDAGKPLPSGGATFLTTSGLLSLLALANGEIDRQTFSKHADVERAFRIREANCKAELEAAKQAKLTAVRDAAVSACFVAIQNKRFSATRNTSSSSRTREAQELKRRFNIDYIEPEHYSRAIRLLKQVAHGQRLKADDVVWLSTQASDCWTDDFQQAWHRLEAEALTKAWKRAGQLWDAVNASAHWRQAHHPDKALELTGEALVRATQNPKSRSALLTTRGGAMRDLGRAADAKSIAMEAHKLAPKDFRPCTLLGAILIDLGDIAAGHAWYVKAEKMGATRQAIDRDLQALVSRSEPDLRDRICAYLLSQDAERFAWAHKLRARATRKQKRTTCTTASNEQSASNQSKNRSTQPATRSQSSGCA